MSWDRRVHLRATFRRLSLEPLEPRLCLSLSVPALSSLPGADHTVYLDFDGHVTEGTHWNNHWGNPSIQSPAYDIDGNNTSFSSTELTRIRNSFERIAEDFSPFEVNVTTVEPSAADLRNSGGGDEKWGMRVVISSDTEGCGCGGVAYIGSFNWNSDTPSFVFNRGEKSLAEAASHEVGHGLFLAHDGTQTASYYTGHGSGATSWAPIMGVGYSKNVTTWDKGEYTGASNVGDGANYGRGPNDLEVITRYNGFGYRDDDHGNNNAGASALALSGAAITGDGIIERTNDVDVFSFTTAAGRVRLNIDPNGLGANLDVLATLVDANNNVVATSNPANALNAAFDLNLHAGQYFVHVDGTGVGNPGGSSPTGYSDYGSLGQYSLSGEVVVSNTDYLSVAASNANRNEGDSSTTPFTFAVTRTGDLSGTTTVDYAVTGNGSNPANASDFGGAVLPSGSLTFSPNQSSKVITIDVQGDQTIESDEGFRVQLSNASGDSVITTASANGVIQNDDQAEKLFRLSLQDAAKLEGTGGEATAFVFKVTRTSGEGSAQVRFRVRSVNPNPAKRGDFEGRRLPNVRVRFSPGQISKTVTVRVNPDSRVERDEQFRGVLVRPQGGFAIDPDQSSAIATILNDDGGGSGGALGEAPHEFPHESTAPADYFDHHDHDHEHNLSDHSLIASVRRDRDVESFVFANERLAGFVVNRDSNDDLDWLASSRLASSNGAFDAVFGQYFQWRDELQPTAEAEVSIDKAETEGGSLQAPQHGGVEL